MIDGEKTFSWMDGIIRQVAFQHCGTVSLNLWNRYVRKEHWDRNILNAKKSNRCFSIHNDRMSHSTRIIGYHKSVGRGICREKMALKLPQPLAIYFFGEEGRQGARESMLTSKEERVVVYIVVARIDVGCRKSEAICRIKTIDETL